MILFFSGFILMPMKIVVMTATVFRACVIQWIECVPDHTALHPRIIPFTDAVVRSTSQAIPSKGILSCVCVTIDGVRIGDSIY
jgi:hypothetical protein